MLHIPVMGTKLLTSTTTPPSRQATAIRDGKQLPLPARLHSEELASSSSPTRTDLTEAGTVELNLKEMKDKSSQEKTVSEAGGKAWTFAREDEKHKCQGMRLLPDLRARTMCSS